MAEYKIKYSELYRRYGHQGVRRLAESITGHDPLFDAWFNKLLDEYYRLHPIRRQLRQMRLLPDPDIDARIWALEQIQKEDLGAKTR